MSLNTGFWLQVEITQTFLDRWATVYKEEDFVLKPRQQQVGRPETKGIKKAEYHCNKTELI